MGNFFGAPGAAAAPVDPAAEVIPREERIMTIQILSNPNDVDADGNPLKDRNGKTVPVVTTPIFKICDDDSIEDKKTAMTKFVKQAQNLYKFAKKTGIVGATMRIHVTIDPLYRVEFDRGEMFPPPSETRAANGIPSMKLFVFVSAPGRDDSYSRIGTLKYTIIKKMKGFTHLIGFRNVGFAFGRHSGPDASGRSGAQEIDPMHSNLRDLKDYSKSDGTVYFVEGDEIKYNVLPEEGSPPQAGYIKTPRPRVPELYTPYWGRDYSREAEIAYWENKEHFYRSF